MSLVHDRSGESVLASSRIFPMVPNRSSVADVAGGSLSGTCPVCGHAVTFSGFTSNERETGSCSRCGSFNRQRQLALTVRQVCELPDDGPLRFPDKFSIFNTESTGAFHKALSRHRDYTSSEFFGPKVPKGGTVRGVRNEDLQDLSFEGNTFDLVLSSDVLEHMPRPYDAHREVFRVLRPGGRHIFTVPFYASEALDEPRAIERKGMFGQGTIEYRGEKLYHGDPVRPGEGVLVWTIFGLQMLVELARIGFLVSCWNLCDPSKGIIGPWSLVFEARKPG